jgi:hypothetical protein
MLMSISTNNSSILHWKESVRVTTWFQGWGYSVLSRGLIDEMLAQSKQSICLSIIASQDQKEWIPILICLLSLKAILTACCSVSLDKIHSVSIWDQIYQKRGNREKTPEPLISVISDHWDLSIYSPCHLW